MTLMSRSESGMNAAAAFTARSHWRALALACLLANVAADAATLTIDLTNRVQTMDGIGANTYCFPYGNSSGWNWNAVTSVFDELDLHYFRTAPWLSWWETENDNADAAVINWNGFQSVYRMADWYEVPYARWLTQRGYEAGLGVWGFAGWLSGSNPPGAYVEIGETLASYLMYFQISNNVPMPVYEVQNEPQLSGHFYPSPDALVTGALAVVQQLDHFGLTNMILHGPNHHQPAGTVTWAGPWFSNDTLRSRTHAVSFHTYWGQNAADYNGIWQLAQRYHKPVWATEVTGQYWHPGDGTWYFTYTNWSCALDGALRFYRALAWSHASRVYQWTILGHDAVVGKNGERYPSFYTLMHFANFIPPGAVFVTSSTSDANVFSLVFTLPDETLSLIMINDRSSVATCDLTTDTAPPMLCTEWFTSREGVYFATNAPLVPGADGTLTFALPAKSVTSARLAIIPEAGASVLGVALAVLLARARGGVPRWRVRH